MTHIHNGRFTAEMAGDFVVFLIGMRINKLLRIDKWGPVASAMGPMLSTLYRHPEKGFLGGHTFLSGRTILSLQYWRSLEDLERFARDPADPHLGSWRNFNQAVGADGTVGIFHETYHVRAGEYESLYGNMPLYGLASVGAHVPAVGRRATMRQRLGAEAECTQAEPAALAQP
jgi:hypothetical protein